MENIDVTSPAPAPGRANSIPWDVLIGLLAMELQFCEYSLIQFMYSKNAWPGTLPPPPAGYDPNLASVELGQLLFLMKNPKFIVDDDVRAKVISTYGPYFANTFSLFTVAAYAWLQHNTLIYEDGSVLSSETYCTYDQGWFAAFLNFLITMEYWNFTAWPQGTPAQVALKGRIPGTVTLGIMGDWGTGAPAATGVMSQLINNQQPDYLLHLGDVYYSGAPSKSNVQGGYFYPGEEMDKLINAWPSRYQGRSFTLNSNHEMYTGGFGYFNEALYQSTAFVSQGNMSYFALRCGDWTILGLDSGYFASVETVFMDGHLKDWLHTEQTDWIASLKLDPAKTIVMTHHTAVNTAGTAPTELLGEVVTALGGAPYAWYFGHTHNGIAYTQPLKVAGQTYNTYFRCAGHGALPYGQAQVLINNPQCQWQAGSFLPGSQVLYNGYVTLTFALNASQQVRGIVENFYDTSNATQPMFSKTIF